MVLLWWVLSCFSEAEECLYFSPCSHSLGPWCSAYSRNRCFWLCNHRNSLHHLLWWGTASSPILFSHPYCFRVKLQHSWQGASISLQNIQTLAPLPRGLWHPYWCCHWSQDLGILLHFQNLDLLPSLLVWVSFIIQYDHLFLSRVPWHKTWLFNLQMGCLS